MRSLHSTETTIDQHHHQLVNGNFSPADASEIINLLINTKINFLKLRNFSQQMRFDRTDDEALRAIDRLQDSKESIRQLIQEATTAGRSVIVKSDITITLH
jgi:hypothetical protein